VENASTPRKKSVKSVNNIGGDAGLKMSERLFPFLAKDWGKWEESMMTGEFDTEAGGLDYTMNQKRPKSWGNFMRTNSMAEADKEWVVTRRGLTKNYKEKLRAAIQRKRK